MANAANNDGDKYANLTGKIEDLDKYVHQAYDKQIDWYWKAGGANKQNYKRFRFWTIVLGSLVTLIASLTTTEIITKDPIIKGIFTLLTPILAAILTIINTMSQNFQWGATWRDMVVNASRLQKEKNRFLATKIEERDYRKELIRINTIVLEETQAFFRRILDTEAVPTDTHELELEEDAAANK
ncbi:MAG: DUF4231 domain-containing protein [Anaerolineales bacterium]|nr:DUF4231 domain-containing protein [Anaerolineales bacterium]